MSIDLRAALPLLLPKAIAWVSACAAEAAKSGQSLDSNGLALANRVGVADPARIRVQMVDRLPTPSDPELYQAATQTGLVGPQMAGVTFGHSIFIRHGYLTTRLLSHECRHVYQYEQAGSIAAFLPVYLEQIVSVGYAKAPLEEDARRHEFDV